MEVVSSNKPLSANEKIINKIESLETVLISLKKTIDIIILEVKQLKKQSKKTLLKTQKGKKNEKTEVKPHGFAVPSKVSDELCSFMECDPGTLIARTQVTKKLTEYIKLHNLQNPEQKKQILPDETLYTLLGEESRNVFLTHFTIQKYMNHHFFKK